MYAESRQDLGLFYNYNESGRGIAKNGPKKKPFFKFWEQFAGKFWKLITLNFVYFVTSGLAFIVAGFLASVQTENFNFLLISFPVIILFGPATAAASQVVRKFTLEKPIFMMDEYKTAFKKNFKQALPVGIFDVFFISAFLYGIMFYGEALDRDPSIKNYVMIIISTAIAAYFLMAHFYIYLEIVSLTLPLGKIIKNALLLTVMGIKVNIISFVVWVALILLIVFLLPYSVFALPVLPFGWLFFLCAFNSYPVIQKYIINPFYEAQGLKNPELPEEDAADEKIFTDRGGTEEVIKKKTNIRTSGKVIK